jgi:hypothetical protein
VLIPFWVIDVGVPEVLACSRFVRQTPRKGDIVAVAINLDAFLDKAYENGTLADVLAAPVSALAGVTDADAELLKKAFNINTVADLGKNQYFRAAQLLAELAEDGAK